jgi:hypothetical protein
VPWGRILSAGAATVVSIEHLFEQRCTVRMGVTRMATTVPAGQAGGGHGRGFDRPLAAVEARRCHERRIRPVGRRSVGDRIVGLEAVLARLAAHQVTCVAVFDARGDAPASGARSSQAWLRHRARLSPGEASARVGLARRLRHHPGTAAAFAAGRIRARHAEVITRTLDAIAPALDGEQAVASWSRPWSTPRVVDPLRLASRCRRLRDAAAPTAVAEDWDAFTARELSLSRTIGG